MTHMREVHSVRSSVSQSEQTIMTLKADVQSRDLRIQELESRLASLRKEFQYNDEVIQKLRIELRDVSEKSSQTLIIVCYSILILL